MIKLKNFKPNITTVIWLCYVLSILWWLLYPLVSISTGEWKPRGLYVDENALLVNSVAQAYLYNENNQNNHVDTDKMHGYQDQFNDLIHCNTSSYSSAQNAFYCYRFASYHLTYLHIDPSINADGRHHHNIPPYRLR